MAPSLAMLSLPAWKCPEWTFNASQVNTSSPEFIEEWQKRIREVMVHGGGVDGWGCGVDRVLNRGHGVGSFVQRSLLDLSLVQIQGIKILP